MNSNNKSSKPHWLRVRSPNSKIYKETKNIIETLNLNTICQEAACPNIGECWSKKHAAMMILGSVCTRACKFCNVKTGIPQPIDTKEPYKIAQSVKQLSLSHIVITSVDRDDLPDGGAEQFAKCILEIKKQSPATTIEVLTPDWRNKSGALEIVVLAKPDVYNHNIETVPSLYREIRPGARYYNSLRLLDNVKKTDPEIFTKSGIMLGLGETKQEVMQVMDDMIEAKVDFITISQYLSPGPKYAQVKEYISPEIFDYYGRLAKAKGFLMVSSTPLTRSSYHADEDFLKLKQARLEQNKL
ncbi:lipoyl synthase [Candidatus Sneabacter namystus]|uniref:Lipoyl synthase n=1 Tax=Candidatus Sneabacter namystus TaxID=2601646 RepID=A0A5C0UJC0_9RICK|nr:lipoyl synthase [Candidatus Sneabacter namystus]QEK39889.1 lipoyl synthase [Candidatus Sneabacter namystus]